MTAALHPLKRRIDTAGSAVKLQPVPFVDRQGFLVEMKHPRYLRRLTVLVHGIEHGCKRHYGSNDAHGSGHFHALEHGFIVLAETGNDHGIDLVMAEDI